MVIQKQKHIFRYRKSGNILSIGVLVLIVTIWFGILIQKGENDIFLLGTQMKVEAEQIRQRTNVRVQHNTRKKTSNGIQAGSGVTTTGQK